jgi:two-component system KDP operon response regulator KdpE
MVMREKYDRIQAPIRILFIEDSAEIQEATRLIFEIHWPEAEIIQALTGVEGLELMKAESPDMVILDLGLPDMDGMKVLRDIRGFSDAPVVILTVRGEETDKIRGLELGADDFIVKPFSHREILARVKRVMYPCQASLGIKVEQPPNSTGTKIDFDLGLVSRNGKSVKLTNTEMILLRYLASHDGRSLGDNEILTEIWGEDYVDSSEYLNAYIHSLRQKVEDDPNKPKIIIRDENGYKFVKGGIQST